MSENKITTALEEAIDSTSKISNIPKDKLRAHTEDWVSALMEKGVIVSLQISRWRASCKIEPQEVGIDLDNPAYINYQEQYLSLGTKKLLPKRILKEISTVESRARKNLDKHSHETVWGHFVPHTTFAEWKVEDDVIRKAFFEKSEEIATNWDELTKEVVEDYQKFLFSNYQDKIKKEDFEDMANSLITEFKRSIISAEEFVKTFEYDTYFTFIPLPSIVQKDIKEKEKLEQEIELQKSESVMQHTILEETMKKKSEHIDEFIQATAGALSSSTERIISEVRIAIGENGEKEVSKRVKNKLLKLIKTYRSLDFFQEDRILSDLNNLEIDLNKTGEDKKTFNDIQGNINSLENSAKGMLENWLFGKANNLEF